MSGLDGHLVSVSVKLNKKIDIVELKHLLSDYSTTMQKLNLPGAPKQPIIIKQEEDRPQSRLDRNAGEGMSIVVGRLRHCPVFDVKFSVLGHNTIRGAAGTAILNAELLHAERYFA